jgi:tetratricopeptide (TPR) repeat protein
MSQRPTPERPVTVQFALESAVSALHARDAAEAERLAAYVLRSSPGDALAAKTLGQALLMQDRPQDAIEPLRRSAKRSLDAETETLLGRALSSAGRQDEALAALRLATSRRPAFVLAFLELGEQLGWLGRLDEAAGALEEGLALAPDALPLRMALAHLSLSRNDRAAARRLFEEVRRAAPHRHDAILGLAHVMAMDGDFAEAAALCREALALRPDDAMTQIELARCLLEQGDRPGAEAILRAATRGGAQLVGTAVVTLASAARGRLFLRPSDALRFLKGASGAETPAIDSPLAADFA